MLLLEWSDSVLLNAWSRLPRLGTLLSPPDAGASPETASRFSSSTRSVVAALHARPSLRVLLLPPWYSSGEPRSDCSAPLLLRSSASEGIQRPCNTSRMLL